jgi:hypothetical protein
VLQLQGATVCFIKVCILLQNLLYTQQNKSEKKKTAAGMASNVLCSGCEQAGGVHDERLERVGWQAATCRIGGGP